MFVYTGSAVWRVWSSEYCKYSLQNSAYCPIIDLILGGISVHSTLYMQHCFVVSLCQRGNVEEERERDKERETVL